MVRGGEGSYGSDETCCLGEDVGDVRKDAGPGSPDQAPASAIASLALVSGVNGGVDGVDIEFSFHFSTLFKLLKFQVRMRKALD